ncbi:TPA: hypothetical protein RG501_RS04775 [Providencia rettgeri]|nr:hypothetical protein [Providencia rettgeri]
MAQRTQFKTALSALPHSFQTPFWAATAEILFETFALMSNVILPITR